MTSHEANVCDSVYDAFCDYRRATALRLTALPDYVVQVTMLRMANRRLAAQTDREEMLDRAACREVTEELLQAGACNEGMNAVGVHATSFLDLGKRIAHAGRDDWMRWAEDSLSGDAFSDVHDGWYSVTSQLYYEYDDDYEDEDDYDD